MSNPFYSHPAITHLIEGSSLMFLAILNGTVAITEAFSEADWAKLTGTNGVIFVLAIVGLGFWGKAMKDEKNRIKEDEAKERRHAEALEAADGHFKLLIEMNKQNADDLKDLTVQSIKANMKGTAEIAQLRHELASRPCAVRGMAPLPINEVS